MKKILPILLVMCLVIAVLRVVIPAPGIRTDDIFKDLAHIFVGGLFGAAFTSHACKGEHTGYLYAMAVGLTSIEVLAFIISKL